MPNIMDSTGNMRVVNYNTGSEKRMPRKARTLVENIAHAKFTKDECTSNKRARKLVHDHDCAINTTMHVLKKNSVKVLVRDVENALDNLQVWVNS